MDVAEKRTFNPGLFLTESDLPDGVPPPDLLILNQPISNFDVFARLWKHTNYRICADGGANRLHDMFQGALEARRDDYVRSSQSIQGGGEYVYLTGDSFPILFMVTLTHYMTMCENTMSPEV